MANSYCLLVAALLGAAVLLASCSSDSTRPRRDALISFERFDELDTDHDGKINRQEAEAMPDLSHYFDRIDTDHSGFLSWAEIKAARFPVFRAPPIRQQ